MLELTAFDNICHEHLEYYRLLDVINILKSNGLDVFKVSHNNVNGGSLRIFACFKGKREVQDSVYNYLRKEWLMLKSGMFETFCRRIANTANILYNVLDILIKQNGSTVLVTGASTKGNTLLQVCGIDDGLIPYAAEVNSDKFGLRTVGSNIEIIPEQEALIRNPDYFLVLPWHFKNTFLKVYKDYINNGGKLIFPLPSIEIIGKDELNGN
jgi:hypothetical protein